MAGSRGIQLTSSSYRKHQELKATISLYEKLDTIPHFLVTLANVFAAFLTGPLRSKETRPPSLFYHVIATAIRTMTRRLSVRQLQSGAPHTDDVYKSVCKKRGIEPRSEVLEDGTVAHWIGKQGAEKIILNFHGGGFVMPAGPNLFEYIFQMVDILETEGKSVACLFLSYDLAPLATYPRQLEQAASLLRHTVDNLHYSPSSILLTGDSAGGNLVISLLSHLAHPHPAIPPINLSSPLLGGCAICPWFDFITNPHQRPSYAKNHYQDVIHSVTAQKWSAAYLGGQGLDEYNQPVRAGSEWWKGVGEVVEGVLVVVGGDEVFLDGVLETTEKMQQGMGKEKVELYVGKGEFHEQPSLDLGFGVKLGDNKERPMSKKLRGWISSKL